MLLKIDYHFHPNLPKDNDKAEEKAKKWWKKIKSIGLNVIIVTEHVYKNPKRAFEIMSKNVPEGVFVFPGLEYITVEGIDVIIFSDEVNIYSDKNLMTSFGLALEEVLNYAVEHKFEAFIAHPFTLGNTSVVKKFGHEKSLEIIQKFKKVEIANSSFGSLIRILSLWPLRILFADKLDWAKKTNCLPLSMRPSDPKLYTVGSDAHTFNELGTYSQLELEVKNRDEVFVAITSNIDGEIIYRKVDHCFSSLINSIPIVLGEYLIKQKIKLCLRLFGK